jgi:hypothetical protein
MSPSHSLASPGVDVVGEVVAAAAAAAEAAVAATIIVTGSYTHSSTSPVPDDPNAAAATAAATTESASDASPNWLGGAACVGVSVGSRQDSCHRAVAAASLDSAV